MNRHLALAAAILITACATPSQPGADNSIPASNQVVTGSEFQMAVGQEITVSGTNLRIRFDGVSQDSRCPLGVQCVWAGNAVVNLRITSANTTVTLNTGIEPRSAGINSQLVTLVDVKPAARQGGIPQKDYVAVLKVTAR